MLSMTNVSKIFRTDLIETHALRNFSLDVKAGEFLAVTGPSGSGKTTFLNIAGLLEPYESGSYKLDGVEVTDLSDDARSGLRNQKIGFIFQSFNLMPDLNVFDNVDVPLRYRRMKAAERHQRITNALEIVGLAARMKHVPAQLSGGQQQRVAIARALAGDPKLILADEPTGNLDEHTADAVLGEFLNLVRGEGSAALVATHNERLAAKVDRVVRLHEGRL
jgi:putative ABC transport system ATP-binding protein